MRILFLGTVDFSRHCFQEILRNGGEVISVLTLHSADASFHSDYADLSDIAETHRIPLYQIKDINRPETISLIRSLRPDVIFVFGWSQLISKEILAIPRLGCIGTHPALLPCNRGRHPLIWPLVRGDQESGLTFLYLDEGTDSGDILWQKPFPITLEDDASSLYEKIKDLASLAIQEFLPILKAGKASRTPQDHRNATYGRKRSEKDGEIQWDRSTLEIYNLIRALTRPYPGAHTYVAGKKLSVWRSELTKDRLPPGARDAHAGYVFCQSNSRLDVKTGDGFIRITDFDVPRDAKFTTGILLGASQ